MASNQRNNLTRTYSITALIFRCARLGLIVAPSLIVVLVYCFISFLYLPQKLPDSLRLLLLILFIACIVFLLLTSIKKSHPTTQKTIARAIENASHLPHFTLQTFIDKPAHVPYTSHALWQYNKQRIEKSLPKLKIAFPHLHPYSFFLLITISLFTCADLIEYAQLQPESLQTLISGFLPNFDAPRMPSPSLSFALHSPPWINSSKTYEKDKESFYQVPQSSKIDLDIKNIKTPPTLYMAGRTYDGTPHFTNGKASPYEWDIKAPIEQSGEATLVGRGRTLASYQFKVIQDPPAKISWEHAPQNIDNTNWTIFSLNASHPFGVEAATLSLTPQSSPHQTLTYDIKPTELAPTLHKTLTLDLSHYSWADSLVTAQLSVKSVSGETAHSSAILFQPNFPTFDNPLSQSLLKLRKAYDNAPQQGETFAVQLRYLISESQFLSSHYGYLVNALYSAMVMDSNDPSDPVELQLSRHQKASDLLWYLARDIQNDSQL